MKSPGSLVVAAACCCRSSIGRTQSPEMEGESEESGWVGAHSSEADGCWSFLEWATEVFLVGWRGRLWALRQSRVSSIPSMSHDLLAARIVENSIGLDSERERRHDHTRFLDDRSSFSWRSGLRPEELALNDRMSRQEVNVVDWA